MKTFATVLTVISLLYSLVTATSEVSSDKNVTLETLMFDGYENEYFFFTNDKERAVVLTAYNDATGDHTALKENQSTGVKFKVKYKVEKIKDQPSSQGSIIQISTE